MTTIILVLLGLLSCIVTFRCANRAENSVLSKTTPVADSAVYLAATVLMGAVSSMLFLAAGLILLGKFS